MQAGRQQQVSEGRPQSGRRDEEKGESGHLVVLSTQESSRQGPVTVPTVGPNGAASGRTT